MLHTYVFECLDTASLLHLLCMLRPVWDGRHSRTIRYSSTAETVGILTNVGMT